MNEKSSIDILDRKQGWNMLGSHAPGAKGRLEFKAKIRVYDCRESGREGA
jgi:hypothetical protein